MMDRPRACRGGARIAGDRGARYLTMCFAITEMHVPIWSVVEICKSKWRSA